jgi:hypothetical protein
MIFVVLSVLSSLIITFLVMIAVHLLRIERVISDCTDIADVKVKRLYGKN